MFCKIFRQNCISFANFVIKIKHISTEFVKDLLLKVHISLNSIVNYIILYKILQLKYRQKYDYISETNFNC